MNFFSYKVEHDFGLAPNPFGSYCTLAVCKPDIRRNINLKPGDWIFGTGSSKLKRLHQLIYAMQVEEMLSFNEYWEDSRFQYKKPVINGSLVQMYGDNFYHQDPDSGKWIQDNSAHSLDGGYVNEDHLKKDTNGQRVLISKTFYYFGDHSIVIPEEFLEICSEGRNVKGPAIPNELAQRFTEWIQSNYEIGIHGDPIDWKKYKRQD